MTTNAKSILKKDIEFFRDLFTSARTFTLTLLTATIFVGWSNQSVAEDSEHRSVRNEKMMAEYVAAWSAHDVEKLLTFFTEDCVYEDPTLGIVHHGQEGIVKFTEEVFAMQPDFHLVYNRFSATDTSGAAEWTITTTWQGEFHGVDVTGTKVVFTGVSLMEFEDGKIKRNTDYWDLTPVLLQLGVLPEALRELK